MDDEKPKGKVLQFKCSNKAPTAMEIIKQAAEEVMEFPVKKAFLILLDEDGTPSFWGSSLSKEQYAKCLLDFQCHVMEVMYDRVEDYFPEE